MKEVLGYKRYMADENGEIWDTCTNEILNHSINGGYKRCRMVGDGQSNTDWVKVHRAVALAYLERPDGAKKVVQIDGDKLNTRPSNLSWYTVKVVYTPSPRVKKPTPIKRVKPYPKYKLRNLHKAIRAMVSFCLSIERERTEYCRVKTYKNSERVMDIPWEATSTNIPYKRWYSMWYRVENDPAYNDVSIHDILKL